MVNSEDIRYSSKWLYATASMIYEPKQIYSVKAKIDGSTYSIEPNGYSNDVIKAMWNLVVELEKKGKIPEKITVAWG